jgi:hypothetical protein
VAYDRHVLAEWVSLICNVYLTCVGFIDSDPKNDIHYICNTPKHNLRATKNALVICANTLTWWVDWGNRESCILFGDDADAMVFTRTKIAVKRMMDLLFWDIQCIPMPMVEEDMVI